MQFGFPISDKSSNVASQFSTVQGDRRVEVVVLLKQWYTNRFNLAAESFQEFGRVSDGSRDLTIHRSKTRLDQQTDAQCVAGNRRVGRSSIPRVNGKSIDTIRSLHYGKRRRDIAHAAGQRSNVEIPIEHFRPMASIGNAAVGRFQTYDSRQS